MRILIRKLVQTPKAGVEYQDIEIQAELLTAGRAPDQLLCLSGNAVSLRHATFNVRGDRVTVNACGGASLLVNDKEESSAVINSGERIAIGPHTLTVINPPAGFALALELREAAVDKADGASSQYLEHLNKARKGGSKRIVAWTAMLLVLAFGLAFPLLYNESPEWQKKLSDAGFAATQFWSSGPLATVHHNSEAGQECRSCHAVPFEPVANEQCIECHQRTGNHAHDSNTAFAQLTRQQCMDCHEEHNEPENLVRVDQALCVDCHGDIKALDEQSAMENVRDFADAHPSFKVTTHVLQDGEWLKQRLKLADMTAERSNLKFDHKLHLNPAGIATPGGTAVMACSDCHQPDDSGFHMKPVTMETTCRSCHALTFDETAPERQVPHGSPAEVKTSLQEFFSRKFIEPSAVAAAPQQDDLRRGRPGHEREKPFECKGPALDCARAMTDATMVELFERTACFACHEVEKDAAGEYTVLPVKITSQWYEAGRFSHADHTVETCEGCHDATNSQDSKDLLVPDIDNCRQCHGGSETRGKLNSTCIDCHGFHFDDRGFMHSALRALSDDDKVKTPAAKQGD